MIVFDELKHAENIIKNGYKNKKYITNDNVTLVKYWKYKGFSEDEIKDKLKSIMVDYQDLFNGNILEYKVDKAIRVGMNYDLLTGVNIEITNAEIETIKTLETIELQKMMFILLVVWKFRGSPDRFKISSIDLMRLSEVRVHYDTFWKYIYQITNTKMLSMTQYKGKDNYRIHMDCNDDQILFTINNFNNPIYYYLNLIEPENYKECDECGVLIKITSNRKKYCDDCWSDKENERQRIKWHKYKDIYKTTALENPQNTDE